MIDLWLLLWILTVIVFWRPIKQYVIDLWIYSKNQYMSKKIKVEPKDFPINEVVMNGEEAEVVKL